MLVSCEDPMELDAQVEEMTEGSKRAQFVRW
jgi:hypothetical protein